MINATTNTQALFKNLRALEDASFPKQCDGCGNIFHSEKAYFQNTIPYEENPGLTESKNADGSTYLKLIRKCRCGKPILDHFGDRRDLSPKGDLRRKAFDKVINSLIDNGLEHAQARQELLNHLQNKKSKILEEMGIFSR